MNYYKVLSTILSFLTILFIQTTNLFGDEKQTITPEILNEIKTSVTMDADNRAMMNAVTNNDIKKLALNRNSLEKLDHYFAHRIKTGDVTDQKSSGRCWLFTSLNVLRPAIIKKYNMKDFQFSENYLFFWDQLEKSNRFLESVLSSLDKEADDRFIHWLFKSPVDDGGVWNMMVSLIHKYGAVPRKAMLESHSSENTRMMNRLINRKLREGGYELRIMYQKGTKTDQLQKHKIKILKDVYKILLISLGEPPSEFTWRYEDKDGVIQPEKTYTPMSFAEEFVLEDLDSYMMMMNDPSKEYNKLYEIELDRNVYEGKNWTFVNLPADALKKFAKKSILADEPMYFSCDVGKQLNDDEGYLALNMYDYESMFGVKFGMDKKARILTFDSGSTHGMALMGIDTTSDGKPSKWLLENSWGKDRGEKGYLTMTDEWFNEYMFRLVVHKRFVSDEVLQILTRKPIVLPPWDPAY
ncbi:MAG: C1 family peptidase [Calditrichaeota bacterium]|nr:C1 family peptidase [Calditrichota bacterium]